MAAWAVLSACTGPQAPTASLVLINGGIYTVDTNRSWAEAAAVVDGIIVAVAHRQFAALSASELRALGKDSHVLYDLKHVLPMGESDLRL